MGRAVRRVQIGALELLEPRRMLAAQTIQVTTGADTGVGSLRAAITAADAAVAGTDTTISFAMLPTATPIIIASDLPAITAANTTIDGTTGPGGRVEIDGNPLLPTDANAAGTGFIALDIQATGAVIEGLSLKFCSDAIVLDTGSGNAVITNNYIGDVTGSGSGTNQVGILITAGSSDNTIGGATAADANVISGNLNSTAAYTGTGIEINAGADASTTGNIVEGNLIGLTPAGTAAAGNGIGIMLFDVRGNTIENNQVCGSSYPFGPDVVATIGGGAGIVTFDTGNMFDEYNNTIKNNYIGETKLGAAFSNQVGVYIDNGTGTLNGDSFTGNTVSDNTGDGFHVRGSDNTISSNTIESNGGTGVDVLTNMAGSAVRDTISQNLIALNGAAGPNSFNLGIDLNDDGVTANSPTGGTTVTGANGLQPYPTITIAGGFNADMVSLSLTSNPSTMYTIELFGNTALSTSSSGFGQGFNYLGSVTVTTDSTGLGTGTLNVPVNSLRNDTTITATATNSSAYNAMTNPDAGATSEFAADVAIPTNGGGGGGGGGGNQEIISLHVGESVTLKEGHSTLDKTDAFFTDNTSTGPFTATVDYGDGTGLQAAPFNSSDQLTLIHAYDGHVSATYVVTVEVYDANAVDKHTFDVTIVNNPPHDLTVTQLKRNAPTTALPYLATASFLDAGAGNGDLFRVYVNYGDGTKAFVATTQHDTFGIGHQYTHPGEYLLTVTVIDLGDGQAVTTEDINVLAALVKKKS